MNFESSSYSSSELPQVEKFFSNNYSGSNTYGTEAYFKWKIEQNYVTRGLINLVKDQGKIVSTTSLVPKSFVLHGQNIIAAEIGDTYTDQNYQRRGLFSLLINTTRKEANAKGIDLVYGTPNAQSMPGYLAKADFVELKEIGLHNYYFPIDFTSVLNKRFPSYLKPLGNVLGFLNRMAVTIYSYLTKNSPYVVADETIGGSEWEAFGNEIQSRYEFVSNKSADALNWRYSRGPHQYSILSVRKGGELKGYLVYRRIDHADQKRFLIADFASCDSEALTAALRVLITRGLKNGIESIFAWVSRLDPCGHEFVRAGFIKGQSVPVIFHRHPKLEALRSLKKIHFTMGDSDNV